MNVIFYDIDGVFNTARTIIAAERQRVHLESYNEAPFLDLYGISFMVQLAELTDAKLVCSSTWREHYTLEEITQVISAPPGWRTLPRRFKHAHAPQWCTGAGEYETRYNDINEYISKHHVENFVILDDRAEAGETNEENFVQVDPLTGITFENMQMCGKIMGNEKLTNVMMLF